MTTAVSQVRQLKLRFDPMLVQSYFQAILYLMQPQSEPTQLDFEDHSFT
jgi:hypothetical protein